MKLKQMRRVLASSCNALCRTHFSYCGLYIFLSTFCKRRVRLASRIEVDHVTGAKRPRECRLLYDGCQYCVALLGTQNCHKKLTLKDCKHLNFDCTKRCPSLQRSRRETLKNRERESACKRERAKTQDTQRRKTS